MLNYEKVVFKKRKDAGSLSSRCLDMQWYISLMNKNARMCRFANPTKEDNHSLAPHARLHPQRDLDEDQIHADCCPEG